MKLLPTCLPFVLSNLLGVWASPQLLPYNPVAQQAAEVVSGNARFTILTPSLIRIEWAAFQSAGFEDRATVAMFNRNLPVPKYSSSTQNNILTITTANLSLTYEVGTDFSADTLAISNLYGGQTWHYGDENTGILPGTIKSLDELNAITLNCTALGNMTVKIRS
jgi:hypothetical protein